MPLPAYIQTRLRQYDYNEASWGGRNNSHTMGYLAEDVRTNRDETYVLSHQFIDDMQLFSNEMYTIAQLQTCPTPLPARTCRNAIRCLRRRI